LFHPRDIVLRAGEEKKIPFVEVVVGDLVVGDLGRVAKAIIGPKAITPKTLS